ncbi:MAG: hypothetical protein QY323_05875 [Patescibacteria group bacterium]|nr:MAG: hypothetical protein QY323_05875 [Patescibacteria group bacterium]
MDPLGSNKNPTTRESARASVEKYARIILTRVTSDGAGFYDMEDFRGFCGVGEKDRLRGDFVLQAAKKLVQEGELQSVKGGMFKRVEKEDNESSEEGAPAAVPEQLDQDATASVDELVEIEVLQGAKAKEEVVEEDADEGAEEKAEEPTAVPAKRKMSPRGSFRAWALSYMQPDVIFRTKDLLLLAVEAEVVVTTAAGQLQLNRLVKEGLLNRKRRGYVSLAVAEKASAPDVSVQEEATVSDAARAEVVHVVPAQEPEPPSNEEPKPAVRKKAKGKPKAAKRRKAPAPKTDPNALDAFIKLFQMQRDELAKHLRATVPVRKTLAAAVRSAQAALDTLDDSRADAQAKIEGLDRSMKTLKELSRSLRPQAR